MGRTEASIGIGGFGAGAVAAGLIGFVVSPLPVVILGALALAVGVVLVVTGGRAPDAGDPVDGKMPTPVSEALTPRYAPTMEVGTYDVEIGETTVSQPFVPDYSAQAMPGLTEIYAKIRSGKIKGYLMVVGGPDRSLGVSLADGEPITIGRSPECTLRLSDPGASGSHVTVVYQSGAAYITDNQSRNGTFVNNERVAQKQLETCDVVAFGQTKILVTLAE